MGIPKRRPTRQEPLIPPLYRSRRTRRGAAHRHSHPPSFPRKRESTTAPPPHPAGPPTHRHSRESGNPHLHRRRTRRGRPPAIIPAKAGIHTCIAATPGGAAHPPSFPRKRESTPTSPTNPASPSKFDAIAAASAVRTMRGCIAAWLHTSRCDGMVGAQGLAPLRCGEQTMVGNGKRRWARCGFPLSRE